MNFTSFVHFFRHVLSNVGTWGKWRLEFTWQNLPGGQQVASLPPRPVSLLRGEFVCKWQRFLSSICRGQSGISSFLSSNPSSPPPRSLYRSSVSFPPSTPVYHLEWEVISASLWPLLCLLSQTTTNLLTSCSWLTATGSADCRSASKWHKQRNNKESVWWKYQDRTSPLQKWCPYFCFGCRYYSIFVWSCIVLFFFPQWDKNGACVRHSNWTRSSCSFCVIVISQLC